MSGFEFNFVTNSTAGGINQFVCPHFLLAARGVAAEDDIPNQPTNTTDDNTILGLNGDPSLTVSILSSGNTSIFWLHVIGSYSSAPLFYPQCIDKSKTPQRHSSPSSPSLPSLLPPPTWDQKLLHFTGFKRVECSRWYWECWLASSRL